MHNLSLYCAAYNLNKMAFPWRAALENWTRFLGQNGQIVLAINTSEDNTYDDVVAYTKELSQSIGGDIEYTVIKTDIPYSDALFDGKIKDAALKACNRDFCCLLDIDEMMALWSRMTWEQIIEWLGNHVVDGVLIPSLDIFHDESSFKSLGQKFYLHKNLPHLGRGPVNFAMREDGSLDVTKSDTTEVIKRATGELGHFVNLLHPGLSDEAKLAQIKNGMVPVVFHLGYLDKQQRLRQSAFWAPHWNNRAKAEVEKPLTLEDLDKMPHYPHNLRHWNAE